MREIEKGHNFTYIDWTTVKWQHFIELIENGFEDLVSPPIELEPISQSQTDVADYNFCFCMQ